MREFATDGVRMSGAVNIVDRDDLERELADGASVWDLDPRGAPVEEPDRTVRFKEIIPVRTKVGTTYDFIEKRVVPVVRVRSAGARRRTIRISTDGRGRLAGPSQSPARTTITGSRTTLMDPDGHVARRTTYASVEHEFDEGRPSASLGLTVDQDDASAFGIGDEIDLTMRDENQQRHSAEDDRRLFYLAQRGLRDVTVARSPRFVTEFPAWGPPNAENGAVRFTGTGYVDAGRFQARFRSADRAITVELRPDKARYGPRRRGDRRRPDARRTRGPSFLPPWSYAPSTRSSSPSAPPALTICSASYMPRWTPASVRRTNRTRDHATVAKAATLPGAAVTTSSETPSCSGPWRPVPTGVLPRPSDSRMT